MNKLMTALLAIAMSVPVLAFAQSSMQQDDSGKQAQKQESNQAAMDNVDGMNTSPHHEMTGMVSYNGKRFMSNNVSYKVSNPGSLKNYMNQNVTVKFQFNTSNNTIKVDKVTPAQ